MLTWSIVKFFNKKGFTLTELIVAVTISTILLVLIFKFVADTVGLLTDTTRESDILVSLYEFVAKFDNYKNTFPLGSLIKDYTVDYGYDAIVLKTYDSKAGVLFGVVNTDTMQLDKVANYPIFGKKVIGYRELSQADLLAISGSADTVYSYTFFPEKTFPLLNMKNFQIDFYNSGTIIDMNAGVITSEMSDMRGFTGVVIPQDSLYKVDLDF